MMEIKCSNIKQVIVKTALLQLRDKIRKDYYIITADYGVRKWVTIKHAYTTCVTYTCVTDPRLMVFKKFKGFIIVETISEQSSDKTIRNNFQELSENYFRINLS